MQSYTNKTMLYRKNLSNRKKKGWNIKSQSNKYYQISLFTVNTQHTKSLLNINNI